MNRVWKVMFVLALMLFLVGWSLFGKEVVLRSAETGRELRYNCNNIVLQVETPSDLKIVMQHSFKLLDHLSGKKKLMPGRSILKARSRRDFATFERLTVEQCCKEDLFTD